MVELIVTPTSISSLSINEADGFLIGEEKYALRMPYYFSHQELLDAIAFLTSRNKSIYISVTKIMHESDLADVEAYLEEMKHYPIDGFYYGDLAVYQIARKLGIESRLIYHPETYITNYESVNYFAKKGIKRVVLAKEITLPDLIEIGNKAQIDTEILAHGALNMFHSKRDLVSNYFRFLKDETLHHNEQLYIIEEKRENEKYPIIEDQNGTHIFSSHDLCTIEYLEEIINAKIKTLRIDGYLKTDEQLSEVTKIYHRAINDFQNDPTIYQKNKTVYVENLQAIPNLRAFNTGFLFKKTVYKG